MTDSELAELRRDVPYFRIALRRATVELAYTADARLLRSPFFAEQSYPRGVRGIEDLSYDRPLRLDKQAPARW